MKSEVLLSSVFLALGPDAFRLWEFIKNTKQASAQKYGDFSVQSFSYPSTSLSSLRSELFAPAFLSEKRILFVSGLPWSASDKITDEEKEKLMIFAQSLSELPADVVVFFIAENPDKRTKFFKTLQGSVAKVYDFPLWDPIKENTEYLRWIQSQATLMGTTIDVPTAQALMAYSGHNLSVLATEIQKLSLRRFGEKIQQPDIAELCVPSEDSVDFAFSNALSTMNPKSVLSELNTLFNDFTPPEIFHRDIVSTIRNILKSLIAKKTGADVGLHPFVLKKLLPILSKISSENIIAMHQWLLAIDVGSKTGKYPLSPDAKLFIIIVERILYSFVESSQSLPMPSRF